MTTDSDLDRQIQDYLQSGPAELSDRVLWAARAQLSTTRRRRASLAWLTPWRNTSMSQSTRLLLTAGGALALVVAIGAGILGGTGKGNVGGSPSPSPTAPSPSTTSTPSAAATIKVDIPVYPAESVAPLTAEWETDGGAATTFGVPEVGPDGRIWAASSVDSAFRILTADGKLSETWGAAGTGNGQFNFKVGTDNAGAIAFAPDGGFWVLDTGNFRVQRFDRDRKFLSSWGRYGSADGEFLFATDIGVDAMGLVFVSDDQRRDIQVFTSDGVYSRSVAVGSAGPFLDAHDDGWVLTDRLPDGRPGIVEYKPDGSVQGGIDMPDMMPVPLGVARDDNGSLYVVGLTATGAPSTLVRFAADGGDPMAWDAGGLGVAVTPSGDAAYVLQADVATIKKYVMPAP